MIAFRLARVVLHLFAGLGTCAILFPMTNAAGRQEHIKRWSIKLLALFDIRLELKNNGETPAATQALVVANHVSWLDIFVMNAVYPCHFVAKADIRNWPLIGWLCAKSGTIFLSRSRLREVRRIYQGLVACLDAGERVAFFPESTTSVQGRLLPFHANLFEAAIEANVPVQPYALRYLDSNGHFAPAVDFADDMTFAQSVIRVLKARKITAQIEILPLIEPSRHLGRRALAEEAYCAIASALATQSEPVK